METTHPAWWKTPLYILSWILLSILCLVDAFLARNAVLSFLAWNQNRTVNALQAQGISPNQFQYSSMAETVDKIVLLVLGCAAVALVIWIEYTLRKHVKQGDLVRWVATILLVEVVIAAIAILVQTVLV